MDNFQAFLQISVSLVFVLALLFLFTRYLLPFYAGRRPGSRANMRVVDRLALGVRISLCLVKVGKRYLLLGVTPTRVDCLAEISGEELQPADPSGPGVADFAGLFQKSREKLMSWGRTGSRQEEGEEAGMRDEN
ncbi:MAG TPA: flagellar biosynthetic protein FliO [Firmicutes bacterium]|nr:flagellar biosynthetic protein FliO [Bacillota bacterium]